ncbi:MAG: tetratricopeptide repeat protein [Verrucomicrobiae bacterium]|nr:tetratricopeptide repeat protein [Verrucomicrobiae bacterium]
MSAENYGRFRDLLRRGEFRGALALAEEECMRRGGNDVFWLNQQALARMRMGCPEKAIRLSEQALALDPRNAYAMVCRADALRELGKTTEAIAGYEEAARFEKTAPRARKGLLECFATGHEWSNILVRLAEWGLPEMEAAPWRIKALGALGRNDEALEVCRKWLQLQPDHPSALWELVRLEIEKEGLAVVRDRYGKLARIPSRPPVYGEIHASLCARSGQVDEAASQYARLERSAASPRLKRKEAFLMARNMREKEAIPIMEELLRIDPRDMYIHSSYQAACGRIGGIPRAVNFYRELLAIHPDERSLHGRIRKLQRKLEGQG